MAISLLKEYKDLQEVLAYFKISIYPTVYYISQISDQPLCTLTPLTKREAITDALYRAVISFDTYGASIFNSAFTENTIFDLSGDVTNGQGYPQRNPQLCRPHGYHPNDFQCACACRRRYFYQLSHCLCFSPTFATWERVGAKRPKFLAASTYLRELVTDKSDGLWKIEKWAMKIIWIQSDGSVLQRPALRLLLVVEGNLKLSNLCQDS